MWRTLLASAPPPFCVGYWFWPEHSLKTSLTPNDYRGNALSHALGWGVPTRMARSAGSCHWSDTSHTAIKPTVSKNTRLTVGARYALHRYQNVRSHNGEKVFQKSRLEADPEWTAHSWLVVTQTRPPCLQARIRAQVGQNDHFEKLHGILRFSYCTSF